MRFLLAIGTTETAQIDGLSAAGADPEAMRWTPAADAELLAYGEPVAAPTVPVSPTGCPTPSLVTRAVRDHLGFDLVTLDAGVDATTAAPTVTVGDRPGADIRQPEPVTNAPTIWERAREFGASLPDEHLLIAESIPGGTTTALGVLTALGEDVGVSSSLPDNPIERKRQVVEAGLAVSGLEPGALAGEPIDAVRLLGDPVLGALGGVVGGALRAGRAVTLAGGTQLLAVAALVRHAGIDDPLSIATTSYVGSDDAVDFGAAAERFDLDCTVTDPGFDRADHVAAERFVHGEAKEGVGMGGALALATWRDLDMAAVRSRFLDRYDRLIDREQALAGEP
jgi:uncharacterized protein (TIGR00303 family)